MAASLRAFLRAAPVGGLGFALAGPLLARGQKGLNDFPIFFPLAAEGLHDDGVHEDVDILLAGEVRPELGPLGGVESAFEQGAEDGGLNLAPVQNGGGGDLGDFRGGQLGDGGVVEEVAVEVEDGFEAELPAGGHGVKELGDIAAELGGIARGLFGDAGENLVGQEADVLCEEAEHDAVKEMGDVGGVEAASAHGFGHVGELLGGFLGDGDAGFAGAELFGVVKDGI